MEREKAKSIFISACNLLNNIDNYTQTVFDTLNFERPENFFIDTQLDEYLLGLFQDLELPCSTPEILSMVFDLMYDKTHSFTAWIENEHGEQTQILINSFEDLFDFIYD